MREGAAAGGGGSSAARVRCAYLPAQDRVVLTSASAVCARRELNGVVLLESALQLPVGSTAELINVELPLPDVSLGSSLVNS